MKNNLIITILVAVVVGGGAFFGGMKYQQSKQPTTSQFRTFGNSTGGVRNRQGNNSFLPVSGEITSVDDKSITIKLADGGSKIVILSASTKINKTSETDKSELKTGTQVMAIGSTNPDGSVTAQSVQLNPVVRTAP